MDGDSLPVSAFVDHADGTFELGASAYEKRGVAVSVPEWDSTKCIQCNQCAYVCPHATIRPFALTADELAAAPAQTKAVDFKVGAGKGVYKFSMAISPLDCMGCGVCAHVCPVGKALTMQPLESQEDQQPVFDYMVAKVAEKKELQDFTVKGSQFRQPHARVLRLLRRLRRDELCPPDHAAVRRSHDDLQRDRLLVHLGRPGCHQPVHRQQGRQGSCLGQLPVRG